MVSAGKILHTSDGGEHWEVQQDQVGITLFTVKFWDDKRGFAVGRSHTIPGKGKEGVILYTTDGGRTYTALSPPHR